MQANPAAAKQQWFGKVVKRSLQIDYSIAYRGVGQHPLSTYILPAEHSTQHFVPSP